MDFPKKLAELILLCVSTVSYRILINGKPSLSFRSGRGIHHGDPLSPYLFILCANVFSGLIKKGVEEKKLHGVKVARGAPKISHLLFADDNLLFVHANPTEAMNIMEILQKYQTTSDQLVNFDKSEASFNSNVKQEDRDYSNADGNQHCAKTLKIYGHSCHFWEKKKEIFKLVVDKVRKKVKGWKERTLSEAGKEVLIKAVTQAIPTYIMGYYRMPKGLCLDIESIMEKFWWGSKEG